MDLLITNTETQKKEVFKPIKDGEVSFYQCGPTLYWDQHIGNLRSVVLADFMVRTLAYLGYEVSFVRNYTDVGHLTGDNDGDADSGEDRMEKAAARENKAPEEIARIYREKYEEDITKLNTIRPSATPSATQYINSMISMVEILLLDGYAYKTDLAIYFDISKAKEYTRLSKQDLSKLISSKGHGDVEDSSKKNPGDFALWFFKKGKHEKAIQTWQSPWGEGFPGWHIECSAMIKDLLGETIDIHMGGIEHIPIHHSNEIAQSECANQQPFVNYWVHNEHLLVDNKKMSKSSGTSYLLSDIEEKGFSPLSLRYFFLQANYRSKQNFTWESLEASEKALNRLKESISTLPNGGEVNKEYIDQFTDSIKDDFNTPKALAVLHDLLKSNVDDKDKKATALLMDKIFALKLDEVESVDIPQEIINLAKERQTARENKDWAKSDEIRDRVNEMGFEIKDIDNSYQIYPKK